jgi:hypothetical protein
LFSENFSIKMLIFNTICFRFYVLTKRLSLFIPFKCMRGIGDREG